MKPGEALEGLVARLLEASLEPGQTATIERNVRLDGPDGPRQIDVLMRSRTGPFDHLTIIECKDHSRMVTVKEVDALDSVASDVKASKAVLVSRKGFSRSALRKAARLGISLMRADSVASIGDVAFDVPVHLIEFSAANVETEFEYVIFAGPDVPILLDDTNRQLFDAGIPELLRQEVNRLVTAGEMRSGALQFHENDLPAPITVRNGRGDVVPIDGLTIRFTVTERHFRGTLSDLDQASYLHDVVQGSTTTILDAEQIALDYERRLANFTDGPQPGTEAQLTVVVTKVPDLDTSDEIVGSFRGELIRDADGKPCDPTTFDVPYTFRRPPKGPTVNLSAGD